MVNLQKNCFVVFANCMLVKGYTRNAIYDLNGRVFFIDKTLDKALDCVFNKRIIDIAYVDKNNDVKTICEALESEGVGKWMNTKLAHLFSEWDIKWDSPYLITNAILDIEMETDNNELFINQLSDLNCPFLQLRLYPSVKFGVLINVLECINKYEIPSVQILFPYLNDGKYFRTIYKLLNQYTRISEMIVYQVPESERNRDEIGIKQLRMSTATFNNETNCGKIGKQYFIPSLEFYSESLQFNTCLNRKVSLTKDGLIKNCPSMTHDYGHIEKVKLRDVVKKEEFQSWWLIKKDIITECKECEFRHLCSDCRAFIKDKNNKYSKPLKCEYNPK